MRSLPVLIILLIACAPASMTERSISVDGRTVSYALSGEGRFTVVFESGLGDGLNIWSSVFPQVAERTQCFAYDRAGIGHSTPVDGPRDTVHVVDELHAALAAAVVRPPYVLVGHSIGGLYLEGFVRLHPDEVRGWVSVEGRPSDFLDVCAQQGVTDCDPPDSATSGFTQEMKGEWDARNDASQQVRDAAPFRGDLPLRVMTGTSPNRPEPADSLVIFQQLLLRNAAESVNGQLIEAPKSGHYIHTQQPELVIEAIEQLL